MAETSNRSLIYRSISVLATPLEVKVGESFLNGIIARSNDAAVIFLKFYDSTAAPTVGTTTPTLTIPFGIGATLVATDLNVRFANGIWIACVTTVADAGSTAVDANDMVVNIFYG